MSFISSTLVRGDVGVDAQVDLAVTWDALLALWAVTVAAAVGVISSIYPALRAARLDPTTALRAL